jgi:hypothetical protein
MDQINLILKFEENSNFNCIGDYFVDLHTAEQQFNNLGIHLFSYLENKFGIPTDNSLIDPGWTSKFQFDPISKTFSFSFYSENSDACLSYINSYKVPENSSHWETDFSWTVNKNVTPGAMKEVLLSKFNEMVNAPTTDNNLPADNFLKRISNVAYSGSDENNIYAGTSDYFECISKDSMKYVIADATYQNWTDNYDFCFWTNISIRIPQYLRAENVKDANFNFYGEIKLPTTDIGICSMVELLDDSVIKDDAFLLEYINQITKLVLNTSPNKPQFVRYPEPITLGHRYKDSLGYYYTFFLKFDNTFDQWKSSQLDYLTYLMSFTSIFKINDKDNILNTARIQWSI